MSDEMKTTDDGILGQARRLANQVVDYARYGKTKEKPDVQGEPILQTLDTVPQRLNLSRSHTALKVFLAILVIVAYALMSPLFRGLCFLTWAMYFLWRRRTWRRALIVLLVYTGLLTFGHLTRGPRQGDHLTVNNRFIRVFSFRQDVEDLSLKYHAGADKHLILDSIKMGRDLLLLKGSKFLVLDVSGDVAKVALEQPGRFSETDGGTENPVGDSLHTMFVFLPDLSVTRQPLAESTHR